MTKKRATIWTAIVLAVLVVAAGSSLWAHRVIAEHLASSSYDHSRSRFSADLTSAQRAGLLPNELQPLTSKAEALSAATPPVNTAFWSAAGASFYSRQAKEFDHLDARLRMLVDSVTTSTRAEASRSIDAYRQAIATAQYEGLPANQYSASLARAHQQFAAAQTAGAYRRLGALMWPMQRGIQTAIAQRQAHLGRLRQAIGTSPNRVAAIRSLAHQKSTAAENDLASLRLFIAHPGFGQPLARIEHRVQTGSDFHSLLLATADLDDLSARIHARFVKAAPAKWILVSTEGQWTQMYEGVNLVDSTLATTGGPQLPTDHGFFHIYWKISPFTFHSPWPPGSQYWYPDSPVQYWMPFDGGEGLHDAPWRSVFGPGSNYLPTPGTEIDGTHGCVNLPADAATFVWNWAPVGTPVIVI